MEEGKKEWGIGGKGVVIGWLDGGYDSVVVST